MRRRVTCLILLAGLAGLVAACGAAAPQAVTETAGPPLLETATATATALPASAEPFESPLSSPEPFDSPPASPTPEARAPMSLVVLHSNDNWGETEPCGWGQNATGGFRRRATLLAQQRQGADRVLVLDTGDALVGGGLLGDTSQGAAIVAGLGLMDYDALALGPKELGLDAGALRQRLAEATFPVLSANAVWADGGEPVAPPYVVLDVGDYKAAILGLTRLPDGPLPGVQVSDPEAALRQYLPELNAGADLVVVLTNMALGPALDLAGRVPGIDLLIAALPSQMPAGIVRAPETGTIVVSAEFPQPRHTGRQIGRLAASLQPDGSLAGESWTALPLDKSLADDPAMDELLRGYMPW